MGYDPRNELLVVEFIRTGVYTYLGVKEDMYQKFLNAPSRGAFVNLVFKQSNWPYQKGTIDSAIIEAPLE